MPKPPKLKPRSKSEGSCQHFWSHPYVIYEGRKKNEAGIIRYCEACKKVQMAFTDAWGKPPKNYDISDSVPFMKPQF